MSRKTHINALFLGGTALPVKDESSAAAGTPLTAVNPPAPDWTRPRSGSVRGMHASLRSLTERAEAVEAGSAIAEIDPELLDGSIVTDRIADAGDVGAAALVESMRTSGQQVPILVRPHPGRTGRFQIAYGHRRARAAATLGRPVRAIVRALTDDELVVAQGKENLERRDLSYIERALFASRLEGVGFSRDTICAAMGSDETEISRYIAVARAIPEAVVGAIGPAPKIGRPRWLALAALIKDMTPARVDRALASPGYADLPTDSRFIALLTALSPPSKPSAVRRETWKDGAGRKIALVERTTKRTGLLFDERLEPGLGDFVLAQLPDILALFKASGV